MTMIRRSLVMLVALVLAWAVPARATSITFDPTGGGGGFAVDVLDPTVGNAYWIGLSSGSAPGSMGQLLFQANLGSTSFNGNPNFLQGTGGNFFTFVAGFNEQVTSNNGTTLSFGPPVVDGSTQGFFKIYRQAANGNNLTGTCFADCGGTVIASGLIINNANFFGTFTANLANPVTLLDQSPNGNQWGAQQSTTGQGGFAVDILIASANPGYFPNLVPGSSLVFATSQQRLAFQQVDPSMAFSSNGINSADVLTVVGAVNGVSGPNTVLQTDASLAFGLKGGPRSIVPEPASMVLLATGLLGVAGIFRRRLNNAKRNAKA